ncbi:hypothetical protein K2173_022910 [Erythroxylum novogranatense]|uniref:Uncharacterized protein n=1 Tax=Erythroxylum novogranatense TaxID=1862640 RepID=A0AAV8T8S6_9ROSI|nr:hypothetical protein K2173_022910 [Erythroxylum novogranatense]
MPVDLRPLVQPPLQLTTPGCRSRAEAVVLLQPPSVFVATDPRQRPPRTPAVLDSRQDDRPTRGSRRQAHGFIPRQPVTMTTFPPQMGSSSSQLAPLAHASSLPSQPPATMGFHPPDPQPQQHRAQGDPSPQLNPTHVAISLPSHVDLVLPDPSLPLPPPVTPDRHAMEEDPTEPIGPENTLASPIDPDATPPHPPDPTSDPLSVGASPAVPDTQMLALSPDPAPLQCTDRAVPIVDFPTGSS